MKPKYEFFLSRDNNWRIRNTETRLIIWCKYDTYQTGGTARLITQALNQGQTLEQAKEYAK